MKRSVKYLFARLLNRRPSAIQQSVIDKRAAVGNGALITDCRIGKYTYIYNSTAINADIGAFCSIAAGCAIGGGKHPINWVSTSPVFYHGGNVLHKNFAHTEFEEYAHTTIGNDVWIGSRCLIKGGVTIGDGAVVGMGSVVTHDIPPYEIWAGNPARCIRKRFDDEAIAKLLALQWWNWDDEKLEQYGAYFNDPGILFAKLEEQE